MTVETQLTRLLGVEFPIVMGGMTGCGTPELAAAVSNAGGCGIFAAHNAGSPENCRVWIRKMRKLTSKPFGVNLTILPSMGKPPPYREYAQVIIDEGVKIVETAGSNPKQWIQLFKAHAIITIHKCVTIRHALSAEKMGVDVISLDGFECAGHPGEGDVGNYVLQAIGRKKLNTPFICSGGVGDGYQIAAALALGACGVNIGTRLCATVECNWPDAFKRRLLTSDEKDTILMLRKLKNTSRVYANSVAKEVHRIEWSTNDFDFGQVAHLVSGKRGRQAEKDNDPEGGIWTAGQVMGLIDDIPTVAELITRMMQEFEDCIDGLTRLPVRSRL